MKIFRIFILALFGLFILGALLFESPAGKRLIQRALVTTLQRSGLSIEVGSLSGNLPQQIDLKNVKVLGIYGKDIAIKEVHVEWALLPLLRGQLRIERLDAEEVQIEESASGEETAGFTNGYSGLPIAVSVRFFHASHVHWQSFSPFEIQGEGAFKRWGRSAYVDAELTPYDLRDATFRLIATINRFGKFDVFAQLDTPARSFSQLARSLVVPFGKWFQDPLEGVLHVSASAKGTFSDCTGTIDGHLQQEPAVRDWAFKARLQKKNQQPLHFQRMLITTQGLRVKGSGDLDQNLAFAKAFFQARADLSSFSLPLKASGIVVANGEIVKGGGGLQTRVRFESPKIEIDQVSIEHTAGFFEGMIAQGAWIGNLQAKTDFLQENWEVKTNVAYRLDAPLQLETFAVTSPLLRVSGDLAIRPDKMWVGTMQIDKADLQWIQRYNPEIEIFGFASGKCSFLASAAEPSLQQIRAELGARNVSYKNIYAHQMNIAGDWESGTLHRLFATGDEVQWGQFKLDAVQFETFRGDKKDNPVQISLQGSLKTPVALRANGFWHRQGSGLSLSLDSIEGTLLNHRVFLLQPSTVVWKKRSITINPFDLSFGDGVLQGSLCREENQIETALHVKNFPIDLLSFNPLQTKVEGSFNFDGEFKQRGNTADAEGTLSLENGRVESEGTNALAVAGVLRGSLHNNRLKLNTKFDVHGQELLALTLDLPFELRPDAQSLFDRFPEKGPVLGEFTAQGKIEDCLDFLNLGMHRLEGDLTCSLKLSGTFIHPHLEGSCRFIDGYYQNYLTGTEFTHIAATIQADDNKLVLSSLTAQDYAKKGGLTATGELLFSLQERFPFHFDVDFSRLNIVQIDLVEAEARGRVTIDGNFNAAKAAGQVEMIESDIAIPDKIPRFYPDLKVIYKNGSQLLEADSEKSSPFPLELALQIQAPEGIYIGGRGLTSEWKGDFSVRGTYAEPVVIGKLELIHGEFVFAGRRFKLVDGAISLQGDQYKMPLIDISANTSEKGVSITARLKGPLNNPQITFQSVPPLPLSGILSYLLFGKDLSEVNGLQALQLAGTVASVAGEGPDILEITRKTLGVDRLEIIMTPSSSSEGGETIALQVGKILTPGLVITVRQGADDSSPNIAIEIDLTHGFTFEGESQQQPEQGKFSLKWNVNY